MILTCTPSAHSLASMPSPEGKIVDLWLVTDDDALAAAFAADLAARETQNPVTRFHSFDDCLDALGAGDRANGACIAVLDVRSAPRASVGNGIPSIRRRVT